MSATLTNPPAAAGERPIALRMREDLEARAIGGGRRRYWRLRDPVTLKHFELGDDEYFALRSLDGAISFDALRRECERRRAPRELGAPQLVAFLNRLHEQGLVVASGAGQGGELLRRQRRQSRRQWLWSWTRLLGWRWRGVDPQRMLRAVSPWTAWLFSPPAIVAAVGLMLAALALLASHYDELRWRMPGLQSFFSLRNAPLLLGVIASVKVLHELGHALACARFGGRVHELGVMWLVFVPCLYCDVSEAWMFPGRGRRAFVGAAGIYVELTLAAGCTFLWWFSEPGWFNAACWNVMVVASVNTLLLNGNPLLRYDGYFILSDLWEIPNLGQRGVGALRRGLASVFLHAPPPRDSLLEERSTLGLALYGAASTAYRWLVSLSIAWVCYLSLKAYHLEVVAEWMAALIMATLLAEPARAIATFTRDPFWTLKVHWPRVSVAALALGVLLAAVWCVPLPRRIYAPVLVEPAGAKRVYVSAPGTLGEGAQLGSAVAAGQTLAQLANPEMDLEIAALAGDRDRLRIKVDSLKLQQFASPDAASSLPTAQEELRDVETRLEQRLGDRQRLTLTAPQAGTVLSSRRRTSRALEGDLPEWSGNPLEPENAGAYLESGLELCLVGDPRRWEASLVVDENEIAAVHPGQTVYVLLDHLPEQTLAGTIIEVAEIELAEVPPELVAHRDLPAHSDPSGAARPARTYYQARVDLGELTSPMITGGTGEGKIVADTQTLAARMIRWLRGTFRFQL